MNYLRIALPVPFYQLFDYANNGIPIEQLQPGMRIKVPFGPRTLIGILIELSNHTDIALDKIKPMIEVLDKKPILPPHLFSLCRWASDYYHYPLGEVFANALPNLLRQGKAAKLDGQVFWQITPEGKIAEPIKRSTKQQQLLSLMQSTQALSHTFLNAQHIKTQTIKGLEKKGYIEKIVEDVEPTIINHHIEHPHTLNAEQQEAVSAITHSLSTFKTFLLQGVTGSGKTEVYLHCIEQVLAQGKQALVLVPEIGLTPQTLSRFARRFKVPMAVLHSQLSDRERLSAWLMAKMQKVQIIIGTRSAIFTPAENLGIIIIDESHDLSFKQQNGFPYSARDLAIRRGQMLQIPVILGSATPSLESLYNAKRERFTKLQLTQRAGDASTPDYHIIDIRNQYLDSGISAPLITAIDSHLKKNKQVLLFLNRRGYAPVLICNHCGYVADCHHCDAKMTLHLSPRYLHCHHCDAKRKIEITCPKCQESNLIPLGIGTEKLEETLTKEFPGVEVIRVDRDTTRSKKSLEETLERIHTGQSQILIGTQMLAKGHHFPNLTLVAIIDLDSGLLSPDFRAAEHMSQLLVQVAGRAGRENTPGEVYLQTRNPTHPSLLTLIKEGYLAFTENQLKERQSANFPPFSYLALFRSEATDSNVTMDFLHQAKKLLLNDKNIFILGPIPAPMGRRKGFHRAQLLLSGNNRTALHNVIKEAITKIAAIKKSAKLRWSLDIDPLDMY